MRRTAVPTLQHDKIPGKHGQGMKTEYRGPLELEITIYDFSITIYDSYREALRRHH